MGKDIKECVVAGDIAVSNPPLGKLKTRKRKMKWNEIVKEESKGTPSGEFHGSRRLDTWTYYGNGGQQVVFTDWRGRSYPEKMTGDELLNMKKDMRNWNYYPKGKLF